MPWPWSGAQQVPQCGSLGPVEGSLEAQLGTMEATSGFLPPGFFPVIPLKAEVSPTRASQLLPHSLLPPLTFLHRDGGLLLPQPQEDEEKHQRYKDLERQHPLGRRDKTDIIKLREVPQGRPSALTLPGL